MKEIKAFIHPHRIHAVTQALRESGLCDINAGVGCYNITVSTVQRLYTSAEPSEQCYSVELAEPQWRPVDVVGAVTIEVRQIGTDGISPPATLFHIPETSR